MCNYNVCLVDFTIVAKHVNVSWKQRESGEMTIYYLYYYNPSSTESHERWQNHDHRWLDGTMYSHTCSVTTQPVAGWWDVQLLQS